MLTKRNYEPEPPPAYSGPQGRLDLDKCGRVPAEEDARGEKRVERGNNTGRAVAYKREIVENFRCG